MSVSVSAGGPLLREWATTLAVPHTVPGVDPFEIKTTYESISAGYRRVLGLGKAGAKEKLHRFEVHWTQQGQAMPPTVVDIEPKDKRLSSHKRERLVGVFTSWGRIEMWWDLGYPRLFVFSNGDAWYAKPCEINPQPASSSWMTFTSPTPSTSTLIGGVTGSGTCNYIYTTSDNTLHVQTMKVESAGPLPKLTPEDIYDAVKAVKALNNPYLDAPEPEFAAYKPPGVYVENSLPSWKTMTKEEMKALLEKPVVFPQEHLGTFNEEEIVQKLAKAPSVKKKLVVVNPKQGGKKTAMDEIYGDQLKDVLKAYEKAIAPPEPPQSPLQAIKKAIADLPVQGFAEFLEGEAFKPLGTLDQDGVKMKKEDTT